MEMEENSEIAKNNIEFVIMLLADVKWHYGIKVQ